MSINMVFFFYNEDVGEKDKSEGSDSVNPVFIAVPVVLLILVITALVAVFLYRRYVNIYNCHRKLGL